ncbi:MAG TPA: hypothetical protein VLJ79_23755 [Candidatus Binatia bacterium]|nr:hypothetical protein [Candidatus Binatia bacterium]
MKAKKKTVSDEILQEIVRRIVAAVQPERLSFLAQLHVKRWVRTAIWTFWSLSLARTDARLQGRSVAG